jgi:hypothetical protein
MKRVITFAASVLAAMLATACDSTEPRGPGSIFISSSANAVDVGFFEYTISVDAATPRVIASFDDVNFIVNGLAHGSHSVQLSGLPPACGAGANPVDVNLRGDDTALVVFSIQCPRTTGDLRITVATTGSDLDPDGYFVLVDQFPVTTISSNGQLNVNFMPPGLHQVALSNVASNCSAPAAQSVTVTAGALTPVNFAVTCSPVAVVKLVTSSSGEDRDPDGFMFRLDAAAPARAATGTTHLRVAPGTHTWELSDIQPNCTLGGASSGSITVSAGDTVTITSAATCTAVGYGTAGTTVADPVADTLSNASNNANPAYDIVRMTARYASNWLIVVMHYARPVGSVGPLTPGSLLGLVEFDVDENVATGIDPLINGFGGSAAQGVDYHVALFDANAESVPLRRFTANGFDITVHRVPLKLEGDSVIVRIPLEKLGNDDGNMTVSSIVGTADRPTDLAPNAGVMLARAPAGPVIVNAIVGEDAPPTTRKAGAAARRPAQWPPR